MTQALYRLHFRGQLLPDVQGLLPAALSALQAHLKEKVDAGQLMTIGLFRYKDMLFAYAECIGEALDADTLFAPLRDLLQSFPGEDGPRLWAPMNLVFYHAIPEDAADWVRQTPPEKRMGRLAIIRPEKLWSYVHYHYALTQEGLLTGDKFLAIALHENYLFAYTEEPRVMTNIRRDLSQPSQAIRDWIAVHPMEHFQPWQADPKDHFQTLDTLLLLHQ